MIDEIGILTGQKILEIWGPPGIVIILLLGGIVLLYRHLMRLNDRTYAELEKERAAHQATIQEQKEDIRNLAKAGEAFRTATERHSASIDTLTRLLERQR